MADSSPVVTIPLLGLGEADASPVVFSPLVALGGGKDSPVLFRPLDAIGPSSGPIYWSNLPGPVIAESPMVFGPLVSSVPNLLRVEQTKASLLAVIRSVNMNSATDQPIEIKADRYVIRRIIFSNASIPLTSAVGGIYTGSGKTGTAVVPAAQAYAALTSSGKFIEASLDPSAGTDVFSNSTLYLSLTTPQGAPATADIYIYGDPTEV